MLELDEVLELISDPKPQNRGMFKKANGAIYEFYLSGTIKPPEEYIEIFDVIRHATNNDTIKIYINSHGGDLFTAIQFLRVLSDTDAFVVCSVEGACMSAATMIFLNADAFEITPFSSFMYHNYSSGVYGKGGEQFDQVIHDRKWSEDLLNNIYEDFLTPSEIKSLLANKDIWMDAEEVSSRMHKRIKIREELEQLEKDTKPD